MAKFTVLRGATKDELSKDEAREQQVVWLQDIGWCKAKPLADFKPGEKMGWNCWGESEVVSLVYGKNGKVVGVNSRWKDSLGREQVSYRKRLGSTLTVYLKED